MYAHGSNPPARGFPILRCRCGNEQYLDVVRGFQSDHKCDARCTSATGKNCECSCGGANHGSDHMMSPA